MNVTGGAPLLLGDYRVRRIRGRAGAGCRVQQVGRLGRVRSTGGVRRAAGGRQPARCWMRAQEGQVVGFLVYPGVREEKGRGRCDEV